MHSVCIHNWQIIRQVHIWTQADHPNDCWIFADASWRWSMLVFGCCCLSEGGERAWRFLGLQGDFPIAEASFDFITDRAWSGHWVFLESQWNYFHDFMDVLGLLETGEQYMRTPKLAMQSNYTMFVLNDNVVLMHVLIEMWMHHGASKIPKIPRSILIFHEFPFQIFQRLVPVGCCSLQAAEAWQLPGLGLGSDVELQRCWRKWDAKVIKDAKMTSHLISNLMMDDAYLKISGI